MCHYLHGSTCLSLLHYLGGIGVMYSEHFKTEAEMLDWGSLMCKEASITIISVVKDVTKGDWILFYKI